MQPSTSPAMPGKPVAADGSALQASSVPALPATDPLAFFNRKTWAGMTPSMMTPDAAR
jgi:hypothetical protein